ncbi:hypothetical protein Ae201684_014031 [Aphanomyces euteiches]|uniref:1,3-beta-glucan synthase n=1 Tax=Aphanomyces euteiches TaxID=100861 RepID=A0A6G0WLP8_9STRA|nr:hypothetical protein Ae201684_014031 [Aphanomyces euteiches]KAH9134093.1 hypothetical protein AeRB84_020045 [Aphanomyces euteiches]
MSSTQQQRRDPSRISSQKSGGSSRRVARENYFDIQSFGDDPAPHGLLQSDLRSSVMRLDNGQHGGGVFERLQRQLGFQPASMRNQKEHMAVLLANKQFRLAKQGSQDPSGDALKQLHGQVFGNYTKWCRFLRIKPKWVADMETQAALFFLIWGEAGNLRFMPECLCFLYHNMASRLEKLDSVPHKSQVAPADNAFLNNVVKPMYNVVAKMNPALQKKKSSKGSLDHKNVTNYDDVNEFFWKSECLRFDETNVARAFERREVKTFKERRSLLNPFLAFYRIYFFLLVMLHILIVISYIAVKSQPQAAKGFKVYSNMFSSSIANLRNQALYSIGISYAGLSALKVVLQVWIDGILIFSHKSYALTLYCRLLWHAIFTGIFCCIVASPAETVPILGKTFLDSGYIICGIYAIPVVIAAIFSMFKNAFAGWTCLSILQGSGNQYIGREMGQNAGDFIKYSIFWLILFVCKFLFNLELMIRPLVIPSVELYDLDVVQSNSSIPGFHNLAFIIALWAPMFLVYMYDTQIWLAIFQSVVGGFIGISMKIGHSSRVNQFIAKLKLAPILFDKKVVSKVARSVLTGGDAKLSAPETQARLRFSVVWNECVSSFRLSDLIDHRESAILQYQISPSGQVDDPIFLLAGKASTACDVIGQSRSWSSKLQKSLEKDGLLDVTLNSASLGIQILLKLLGPPDSSVKEIFHFMNDKPEEALRKADLSHIPQLRENFVDLLACLLDLPEPNDENGGLECLRDHVGVVIERVQHLFSTLEKVLPIDWVSQRLQGAKFIRVVPDVSYQLNQMATMFVDAVVEDDDRQSSSSVQGSDNTMSLCTRLFFLLTLDVADALPRCAEAQRRMSFFLNSLNMHIPEVDAIQSMHSFSVVTPYYSEPVLYSLEELNGRVDLNPLFRQVEDKATKNKVGRADLSILKYLITLHPEEWENFLERMNASSTEEAMSSSPIQVRLWASMRGQTLARTVHGMMLYEDAIKMLRWLEIGSDQSMAHEEKIQQMDHIVGMKFSYITSCQIYSQQCQNNDPRAADIDLLMRKYTNWRVSFMECVPGVAGEPDRYDCVLVKSDGEEIVEVYRYELPGHPIVGEGKPENQNIAIPFTRGEFIQTIDMNQEHYFEETLKMPNFLASGKGAQIIGMKEHVFTAKASSLARFMTLQELVFVTLTQRVMANPLQTRMHYGHPDVFDKVYIMTNGGVSKASKGINLSEDVFAGYNCALRGGKVIHVEFMQCGKGRDVTLSHINAFEAKLANGSAESSLSRDAHRMGSGMDFFRLNAMYYSHMGFYISNYLTVVCVFVYAYAKLYVALHSDVEYQAIKITSDFDNLASVMNTQFIFQFGMLMTIPLMATLIVEMGIRQAVLNFIELIVTLGPVFYIFETGTKAHFYDVAIQRGGSKYRGTGRGFAITRNTFVSFFKEYAASHYRKALELMALIVFFGLYGTFNFGVGARDEYCLQNDCSGNVPLYIQNLDSFKEKGQSYGVASFAVWLLVVCWLVAPFLYNTDSFDFGKTRVDATNWFTWMSTTPSDDLNVDSDSWTAWWQSEADLYRPISVTSRLSYAIREFRHVLVAYYIFTHDFDLKEVGTLFAAIGAVALILWLIGFSSTMCFGNKARLYRGMFYVVFVIGCSFGGVILLGTILKWGSVGLKHWSFMLATYAGLYTLLQYFIILNGVCGIAFAKWGLVQQLGYLFDSLLGLILLVPLVILSAIPFMHTIQTRMMYNEGFSKALSTGGEYAATISMFTGIFGGFAHGWITCAALSLGYINESTYHMVNESFQYFLDTHKDSLSMSQDSLKLNLGTFGSAASIAGVLLSCLMCFSLGRKMTIISSTVVTLAGIGLLMAASNGALIIVGVCVCTVGVAMLSICICVYNYEICTQDWKCKAVVMFVFGSSIGYFIESLLLYQLNYTQLDTDWKSKPTNDWRYHFVFGGSPLVLLLIGAIFIPESPVWLYRKDRKKEAEATLVRLRQKHDIMGELEDLKGTIWPKEHPNIPVRVFLSVLLQAMLGLAMSNSILKRESVKTSKAGAGVNASPWQWQFGLMLMLGAMMGLFSIDGLRRKTLLKDILPLVAGMSIVALAMEKLQSSVADSFMDVALFVLYFTAAFSLASATWLSAIEMFPAGYRMRYVALSFTVYYGVQTAVFAARPSFMICNIIMAVFAILVTVVLLLYCASNQHGAIQLKGEKVKEKAAIKAQEEEEMSVSRASRSHSFLRSRGISLRSSMKTPKNQDDYKAFESPHNSVALPSQQRVV